MSRPTRGSVHNSVPNPAASAPCLSCWISSRRCVESSPAGRPRGRRFSASSPSVLQLLVPLAHRSARDAHASGHLGLCHALRQQPSRSQPTTLQKVALLFRLAHHSPHQDCTLWTTVDVNIGYRVDGGWLAGQTQFHLGINASTNAPTSSTSLTCLRASWGTTRPMPVCLETSQPAVVKHWGQ